MTDCKGSLPVTAKVDGETKDLLDEDAEMLGKYRADVVREALGQYVDLRRADFDCPHCENSIQLRR
jgi:predicted transcriptional regulator